MPMQPNSKRGANLLRWARRWRVGVASLAISLSVMLGVPAFGEAATTLGQTFVPTTGNTCNGGPDWEVLQTGRASGPSYAAPSHGVLTSWRFESGTQATTMTMRVFRPTGTPQVYKVIADGGDMQTFGASSGLHTTLTRISVEAGDFVGIRSTVGECASNTGDSKDTFDFHFGTVTPLGGTNTFTSNTGFIWDISAALEPDADLDGYGDETQDNCPSDPQIHLGPCSPPSTTGTVVVPPTVVLPPAPVRATISLLSQNHPVFRVGARSTPLTGSTSRVYPRGTTFSFALDQPATVIVAIQRKLPGRRVGRVCKPPSRLLRNRPKCTRLITKATLQRSARAGVNKIAFSGRIRGRALPAGYYRAAFIAVNSAGTSTLRALSFRIVAP